MARTVVRGAVGVTSPAMKKKEERAVSYTDYGTNVFKLIWIFMVYIKLMIKFMAFLILKNKEAQDTNTFSDRNILSDAEIIKAFSHFLHPVIQNLLSLFIFLDGFFLLFIKPAYLKVLDDKC